MDELDPPRPKRAVLHTTQVPYDEVVRENLALRLRLDNSDQALRAIHSDDVDALFLPVSHGRQLFTRDGADRPYRLLIEEMGEGALTLTLCCSVRKPPVQADAAGRPSRCAAEPIRSMRSATV